MVLLPFEIPIKIFSQGKEKNWKEGRREGSKGRRKSREEEREGGSKGRREGAN